MSHILWSGNGSERGPSRPARTAYESPKARRILADLFVTRWLQPAARAAVPLEWVKVVAEHAMGEALGLNGYVHIDQASVEAALEAAGYRLRRSKTDRHVYVACAPQTTRLDLWRFYKRGGRYPRRG